MDTHAYTSGMILHRAMLLNDHKVKRPLRSAFVLAMYGGMFIAIAGLFYLIAATGLDDLPFGVKKLIPVIPFTTGFVLVLTAGGDIYTSNVLFAINAHHGRVSWRRATGLIGFTYIGNFVGALLFLVIVLLGNMHLQGDGTVAVTALKVGAAKMSRGWMEAFALGIICNLLVCLAHWGTLTTSMSLGRVFIIILPVSAFVAFGAEHSVANMFLLSFAVSIKEILPSETWSEIHKTAADFPDVSLYGMFIKNLVPVTLGNFVGGAILVGGLYYAGLKSELPNDY